MARTPLTTNDILDKTQTAAKFLSLGPQTVQTITDPFLTYGRVTGSYFFQGFSVASEQKNISPAYKIQLVSARVIGIGNTTANEIRVSKVTSAGVVTDLFTFIFGSANQIIDATGITWGGSVASGTIDPTAGDFLRVRNVVAAVANPCQVLVEFMLVP